MLLRFGLLGMITYVTGIQSKLRGEPRGLDQSDDKLLDSLWDRANRSIGSLIEADSKLDERIERLRDAYHAYRGWTQGTSPEKELSDAEAARMFDKISSLRAALESGLENSLGMEEAYNEKVLQANNTAKDLDKLLEELPVSLFEASSSTGIVEQLESLINRIKHAHEKLSKASEELHELRQSSYELLDEQMKAMGIWRSKALMAILNKVEDKLHWVSNRHGAYKDYLTIAKKHAHIVKKLVGKYVDMESQEVNKDPGHMHSAEEKNKQAEKENLINKIRDARNESLLAAQHLQHEISFRHDSSLNRISKSMLYVEESLRTLDKNSSLSANESLSIRDRYEKAKLDVDSYKLVSKTMLNAIKHIHAKLKNSIERIPALVYTPDTAATTPNNNNKSVFLDGQFIETTGAIKLASYIDSVTKPHKENDSAPRQFTKSVHKKITPSPINHPIRRQRKALFLIIQRLILCVTCFFVILGLLMVAVQIHKRNIQGEVKKKIYLDNITKDSLSNDKMNILHGNSIDRKASTKRQQSMASTTWGGSTNSIDCNTA